MVYPGDLTDKEWLLIKEYFEQKRPFGRPLTPERRSIVNAILYVTKSGRQWRSMLPKDFPPWQTVYDYFKQWCVAGTRETVLDALNQKSRLRGGRHIWVVFTAFSLLQE